MGGLGQTRTKLSRHVLAAGVFSLQKLPPHHPQAHYHLRQRVENEQANFRWALLLKVDLGYQLKIHQIHKRVSGLALGASRSYVGGLSREDRDAVRTVAFSQGPRERRNSAGRSHRSAGADLLSGTSHGEIHDSSHELPRGTTTRKNYRIRYSAWEFNDRSQLSPSRIDNDPRSSQADSEPISTDDRVFPALFRAWKTTNTESQLLISPTDRILGVKDWPNREWLPRLVDSSGRRLDWRRDFPWDPTHTNIQFTTPEEWEHEEEQVPRSEENRADGEQHGRQDGPGGFRGASLLNLAPVNAAR